jgi:cellulose biosynthesis protein BcsQ
LGRTIAIANQKGGVGKSTTAINLSSCLGEMGQKVLTIDMDPQGNTTSGMGVEKNEVENTIYELLLGESKLEDCIIPLNFDNLSLIPSNVNLAGAEIELIGVEDKEFILKNAIDQVRDQYDFIIIDCPPSLNMLTINAMTTADTVLVPIQCEYYALEGLSQLMHTIELVQERLNGDGRRCLYHVRCENESFSAGSRKRKRQPGSEYLQNHYSEKCPPCGGTELRYADQLLRQAVHRCRELPSPGRRSDSQGG